MIAWIRRVIAFTRFTIQEYSRSGRIMIEFIAVMVALWLFFWPRGAEPAPSSKLSRWRRMVRTAQT